MTQTRPTSKSARGCRGDEEEQLPVEEAAAEQTDIYGMLGYRGLSHASLSTQQWLAFRQIEL